MPDPEDIFSTTIGGADTSYSFVHAPNICNHDGSIIHPHEYEMKITDGAIVMVNASMKMLVPIYYTNNFYIFNFF